MTTKVPISALTHSGKRLDLEITEVEATFITDREARRNCERLEIVHTALDFQTIGTDLIVYRDREDGRYFYTTRSRSRR